MEEQENNIYIMFKNIYYKKFFLFNFSQDLQTILTRTYIIY